MTELQQSFNWLLTNWITLLHSSHLHCTHTFTELSQSQSHIATDGQSMGLMTRCLLLFDSYGLVFCGAPSLMRGRVCHLYMLLALASTVLDHILLSQIWDFPFCRLLWFVGSRWRYSTPPSHELGGLSHTDLEQTHRGRCLQHLFCCCMRVCCSHYLATAAVYRVTT
jgi:hypothetical protein